MTISSKLCSDMLGNQDIKHALKDVREIYGWLFVSKVFFDTFNKNLIHSIKNLIHSIKI